MKKVLALLLAVVMVLSASVSVMAFEDVTEENANFEAINYFFENGVVEGDTATGNFNPDNNYKRVEMIKVLVGALGYTEEDATAKAGETAYADLNADEIVSAWASGYVNIATEIGMVEGDNGNLNYNAFVTAGELATMILRVLDVELDETGTPWYADAVAKAVEAGILAEDADGAASMTRGNAMGVMYASLDIENAEGETFRTLIEGEEVVEPEAFAAVSTTSVNISEIDVLFNDTVKTVAGITVKKGDAIVENVVPTPLADGKTVRLTVNNSTFTGATVSNTAVKATLPNGALTTKYVMEMDLSATGTLKNGALMNIVKVVKGFEEKLAVLEVKNNKLYSMGVLVADSISNAKIKLVCDDQNNVITVYVNDTAIITNYKYTAGAYADASEYINNVEFEAVGNYTVSNFKFYTGTAPKA